MQVLLFLCVCLAHVQHIICRKWTCYARRLASAQVERHVIHPSTIKIPSAFPQCHCMDLYGDLPPAQGDDASQQLGRSDPASSTTSVDQQAKPKRAPMKIPLPASLAFKPRQAVNTVQLRPNTDKIQTVSQKTVQKPAAIVSLVNSQSFVTTSIVEKNSPAETPAAPTSHNEEFNTNSSFDVQDAYEPGHPNDYIAYCSERLERRKQARIHEENVRRMDEADRSREALEKERRDAAQRGDYQSLLSSAGSMSAGASLVDGERGGSEGVGRGRGRGRGLVNLPAWMTQQQQHTESVAPIAQTASEISAGEQFSDAAAVGIVGIKRKQGANKPSCVILLKNMVAAEEVDEQLAAETQQECSKYGDVEYCVVHSVTAHVEGAQAGVIVRCPDEERVRTFVCFQNQESAVRAFRDLNGRFFAGRQISASFFSEERFLQGALAPDSAECAAWNHSNSSDGDNARRGITS